jgi:hypothetical protein
MDLPIHMVMVDVIDVFDHFCDLQIDEPPTQNVSHLVNEGLLHHMAEEGDLVISTSNFGISLAQRQKLDQSFMNFAELTIKSRQV